MEPKDVLATSRALWNRTGFDLRSDETLAQILDRGSLEDWKALFQLLSADDAEARRLRDRVHRLLFRVPIGYPFFWLAVLQGLGSPVDWKIEPKGAAGEVEL